MEIKERFFLLSDVARLLDCRPHRIVYLLTSRQLPEPALRIGNRRVFSQDDIEQIATKLGISLQHSERQ